MQIPEKYIFFIKERIKESKIFLNRITISSQKRDNNIKTRINTYKNIVKEQNAIINKLKDETSNRIAYAKGEEIQILIRNNGEAVNNEIEGIKKRITNHKEKLSQIKKSIDFQFLARYYSLGTYLEHRLCLFFVGVQDHQLMPLIEKDQ